MRKKRMNTKKILILLIFAIAIVGIIAPVNATVDSINSKNKIYNVEFKEKAVQTKITWNPNGGQIVDVKGGKAVEFKKSKVTYVKKGSEIGTIPIAARSGYTIKGWYTKKTGGTKISENTKPQKSTTYYAQWNKGTSSAFTTLMKNDPKNIEKELKKYLTGTWKNQSENRVDYNGDGCKMYTEYTFKPDGTYTYYEIRYMKEEIQGKEVIANAEVEQKGYYKIGKDLPYPYVHSPIEITSYSERSRALVVDTDDTPPKRLKQLPWSEWGKMGKGPDIRRGYDEKENKYICIGNVVYKK